MKQTSKLKDLTNMKFGRLTVAKRAGNNKSNRTCWLCKCDCGNEIIVEGRSLISGNTQSCGCLRKEKPTNQFKKNLIGKKFGKLTVLKETGKKHECYKYLCKCDCGNIKEVTSHSLISGETQSCGCLIKEAARQNGCIDKYSNTRISCLSSKLSKLNKSGFKGVCWSKRSKKWYANIGFRKKHICLGYFDKKEDAIKARKEAEEKYFRPVIQEYKDYKKKAK